MLRPPSLLWFSRIIRPLRSWWGRSGSISKHRRKCRGCAGLCSTPGGSLPSLAAMFIGPRPVMSGVSQRPWCRAPRRRAAMANTRSTWRRAPSIRSTGLIRTGALPPKHGLPEQAIGGSDMRFHSASAINGVPNVSCSRLRALYRSRADALGRCDWPPDPPTHRESKVQEFNCRLGVIIRRGRFRCQTEPGRRRFRW